MTYHSLALRGFDATADYPVQEAPTSCAQMRTGELSDDFVGQWCVNMREVDTSNEVKRMVQELTGEKTSTGSPGGVWGQLDEAALMQWAKSATTFPADHLVMTIDGFVYPHGEGVMEMLDQVGCAPTFGGMNVECWAKYPRLSEMWEQRGFSVRSTKTEPPLFGAPSVGPPPLPGVDPPPGGTARRRGATTTESASLGAGPLLLLGAALGGAVYWVLRRRM